MTDDKRRKKRSERLSDSFVSRLSREIGPSKRLDAIAADGRASGEPRPRNAAALASMQASTGHGFMRCPHCREYVPYRNTCRGCGTELT